MCRWTPKGSIDGSILLDIVKTLDIIGVFQTNREQGIKPMLLVDAHGSKLDLEFLEYIKNPDTEWYVCIGVSYGTSLW